MRVLTYLTLGLGLFCGTLVSASSPKVCSNLLTYPLDTFQAPLEESFEKLYAHLEVGSTFDETGVILIKSGLHTFYGLHRVLQSHGKTLDDVRWHSFEGQAVLSENKQWASSVQIEETANGVVRVQLGPDYWTHPSSMETARVTVAPGRAFLGTKTLFPRAMTPSDLKHLIREFFAHLEAELTWEDLLTKHQSFERCFQSELKHLPPMNLKMAISLGRPVSFFPTWNQDGCRP